MNLQELRTEIDNLDSELINILSKRFIATRIETPTKFRSS